MAVLVTSLPAAGWRRLRPEALPTLETDLICPQLAELGPHRQMFGCPPSRFRTPTSDCPLTAPNLPFRRPASAAPSSGQRRFARGMQNPYANVGNQLACASAARALKNFRVRTTPYSLAARLRAVRLPCRARSLTRASTCSRPSASWSRLLTRLTSSGSTSGPPKG